MCLFCLRTGICNGKKEIKNCNKKNSGSESLFLKDKHHEAH